MYYKAGVGFIPPEWKQIEILEDKLTVERELRQDIETDLKELREFILKQATHFGSLWPAP